MTGIMEKKKADVFEIYIFTTLRCNKKCPYCVYNQEVNKDLDVKYSVADLVKFIESYVKKNYQEYFINFYGGEPLLNSKFILDVMKNQEINPTYYSIVTNCSLVKKVDPFIIKNTLLYQLSIESNEESTDRLRGKNTWKEVYEALKYIKGLNPNAFCLARACWSEDIIKAEDYFKLAKDFDGLFWQMQDWEERVTDSFVANYKKEVGKLVKLWVESLSEGDYILILPFLTVTLNIIAPEVINRRPMCGCSQNYINIVPNGDIYYCPDLTEHKNLRIGNVKEGCKERKVSDIIKEYNIKCEKCDVYNLCKIRCLKSQIFNAEIKGFNKILKKQCELTKFLINELLKYKAELYKFDKEKLLNWWFLIINNKRYERFQYTEVIP